jgi:hypothetical protein
MFSFTDTLTLREQVKLVELAAEAGDYEVRKHALSILNQYRNPPRFVAPGPDGQLGGSDR